MEFNCSQNYHSDLKSRLEFVVLLFFLTLNSLETVLGLKQIYLGYLGTISFPKRETPCTYLLFFQMTTPGLLVLERQEN